MRIFFLSLIALLMLGCAATEVRYEDRIFEVPVYIEIEPEPAAEIDEATLEAVANLPIYALNEQSIKDDIIRAYVQSIIILFNYVEQLEESLKPFQEKPDA